MIPSNVVSRNGVNVIGDDELNSYVQGCTTAAQLRTFSGLSNMEVLLLGISAVNDGGGGLFYWQNGTGFADDNYDVIVPQGTTSGAWLRTNIQLQAYEIGFEYLEPSPPVVNQIIGISVFAEPVNFPANFEGSVGTAYALPTDTVNVQINNTGTPVGTMTIGPGGGFSFSSVDGNPVSFAVGQRIVFMSLSSDATFNTFAWRMVGSVAP